ncbi:MAG: hypothetical protein AB2812_13090 [Candidatus Sedimenticola endophacoides]
MDAIVSLDGNSLKGGIEYRAHGERGRIEGSFAFDTLDLRGADAGAEAPVAESTAQAGDKVFSGEPLDLQALRSQVCRYLVKDFGTSQSPKSTRQRDSRYCPDRPALITTPSRTLQQSCSCATPS